MLPWQTSYNVGQVCTAEGPQADSAVGTGF